MKGMIPVRGFQSPTPRHQDMDFIDILKNITPLTKIGALCFIAGKIFGVMAIPAVFIPSLNMFAIPLIICWGSLVVTTIVLCSVDHFIISKKRAAETQSKAAEVQSWLAEHPDIREQILAELREETKDAVKEKDKVVNLCRYQ
jgi:uncharacterized membrane protein (DUF106 family)